MTVPCSICAKQFTKPGDSARPPASNGDHIHCTYFGCKYICSNKDLLSRHLQSHRPISHSTRVRDTSHKKPPVTYNPFQPGTHRTGFISGGFLSTVPETGSTSLRPPPTNQSTPTNHTRSFPDHGQLRARQAQGQNHMLRQSTSRDNRMVNMASDSTGRDITWSTIPKSQYRDAVHKLGHRAHTKDVLEKRGYMRGSEGTQHDVDLSFAPQGSRSQPRCKAVALDCEMVGCRDGNGKEHSVLARLSVIDYLTGAVVIDQLVQPELRVTDWRTRYSGVTSAAMNAAVRSGQAIPGIKAAQAELWKHVDEDTIIVGQSLKNDFDALQIIHFRVVDSGIVTGEAIGFGTNLLVGLKTACLELLDIKIQVGKKGHDSVEDSLAAREVVLFCLNETEKLETWALVKREALKIAAAKRAEKLALEQAERDRIKELNNLAKEEKKSFTKEALHKRSTSWELKHPLICLPVYEIPPDWRERHREAMQKQYEMLIAPVEATWASTVAQSREPFLEPTKLPIFGIKWSLPPTGVTSLEEEMKGVVKEDSTEDDLLVLEDLKDIAEGRCEMSPAVEGLIAEIVTLLDDPLDDSQASQLIEPIQPATTEAFNWW